MRPTECQTTTLDGRGAQRKSTTRCAAPLRTALHILIDWGHAMPDSWQEAFKDEYEAARSAHQEAHPRGNGHGFDGHATAEYGVSLDDFYAYMPMHKYLFAPSRELWPGSSVNARIPPVPVQDDDGYPVLDDDGKEIRLLANRWLDQN